MSKTRFYRIWVRMVRSCYDPNFTGYSYYGGLGITVDPRWVLKLGGSFENFYDDMILGYKENLTLDRIETGLNYCKQNCRWVDMKLQARNKSMFKNNTSGITGVNFYNNGWSARVLDMEGVCKSKFFSLAKYGDQAFSMAVDYRQNMISQLNENGAGYSPSHGKLRGN